MHLLALRSVNAVLLVHDYEHGPARGVDDARHALLILSDTSANAIEHLAAVDAAPTPEAPAELIPEQADDGS